MALPISLVWAPKDRFRILSGKLKTEFETCVQSFVDQQKAEVLELNVQLDHVHLISMGVRSIYWSRVHAPNSLKYSILHCFCLWKVR